MAANRTRLPALSVLPCSVTANCYCLPSLLVAEQQGHELEAVGPRTFMATRKNAKFVSVSLLLPP